jgi:hypothetical protein
MPHQDAIAELGNSLETIIERMQAIQRQISSGSQPASMHELDALAELGRQYADVLERFERSLLINPTRIF